MNRIKFVEQGEHSECALACIVMLLNYEKIDVNLSYMRNVYGSARGGTSLENIIEIMNNFNISCSAYEVLNIDDLKQIKYPFISLWNKNHFVVVEKITSKKVIMYDPSIGKIKVDLEEFKNGFSNIIIVIKENNNYINYKNIRSKSYVHLHIKKFMKSNWFQMIFVLFIMIILQIISLVVPILTKSVIDNQFDFNINLYQIAFSIVSIFIICYLLEYVRNIIILKYQFKFTDELMDIFIDNIMNIKFKYFINKSSGDWVYKAQFVEYIKQLLSPAMLSLIIDVVFIIVYIYIMFKYSLSLTLLVLSIVSIITILSFINIKIMLELNNKEITKKSKIQNTIVKLFENIETVKALKIENIFKYNWKTAFKNYTNLNYQKSKISIIYNSLNYAIELIFPILILVFGVRLINTSQITLGTVVIFISLSQMVLSPIIKIISMVSQFMMLKLYLKRLDEIFELDKNSYNNLQQIDSLNNVKINNLEFKYSYFDKKILKNINLTINKNDKISIVGVNGSGKTTLIKCISGMLESTSGEILFNDINIKTINIDSISNLVSYVNQGSELFDGSIRDNIMMSCKDYDEQVLKEVLNIVLLEEFIKELPLGLDTLISESGMNISGGQKQKIILARAILKKPQLLILDEPTSAMDMFTEKKIINNIKSMKITCILISHRLSVIKNFDKIVVMENGKIIDEGNHKYLINNNIVYKNIYSDN